MGAREGLDSRWTIYRFVVSTAYHHHHHHSTPQHEMILIHSTGMIRLVPTPHVNSKVRIEMKPLHGDLTDHDWTTTNLEERGKCPSPRNYDHASPNEKNPLSTRIEIPAVNVIPFTQLTSPHLLTARPILPRVRDHYFRHQPRFSSNAVTISPG